MKFSQSALTSIIEQTIVPIFIPLGFKNNNLDFYRNLKDISQVFEIKFSVINTKTFSFTFSFGFHSPAMHKILGVTNVTHPHLRLCFVAFALPTYTLQVDLEEQVKTFKRDLLEIVHPIFEKYITFDGIQPFVEQNKHAFQGYPYTEAVYRWVTGDHQQAITKLRELYDLFVILEKQQMIKEIKNFQKRYYAEKSQDEEMRLNFISGMWALRDLVKDYDHYFYVCEIERIAEELHIDLHNTSG